MDLVADMVPDPYTSKSLNLGGLQADLLGGSGGGDDPEGKSLNLSFARAGTVHQNKQNSYWARGKAK